MDAIVNPRAPVSAWRWAPETAIGRTRSPTSSPEISASRTREAVDGRRRSRRAHAVVGTAGSRRSLRRVAPIQHARRMKLEACASRGPMRREGAQPRHSCWRALLRQRGGGFRQRTPWKAPYGRVSPGSHLYAATATRRSCRSGPPPKDKAPVETSASAPKDVEVPWKSRKGTSTRRGSSRGWRSRRFE